MTVLQMSNKRDRVQKQLDKAITKKDFDLVDKLLKKLVDIDVKMLEMKFA